MNTQQARRPRKPTGSERNSKWATRQVTNKDMNDAKRFNERYARITTSDYKAITLEKDDNFVRFLPQFPEHNNDGVLGISVYAHANVGVDNEQVLCLNKHSEEDCPVCTEYARIKESRRGTGEKGDRDMYVSKKELTWAIVRGKENEGPVLYHMQKKVRDAVVNGMQVKSYGSANHGDLLQIADIDEGYDVVINKSGSGLGTEYATSVSRAPSVLSEDDAQIDKWMEYIHDNPLQGVLNVKTREELLDMLALREESPAEQAGDNYYGEDPESEPESEPESDPAPHENISQERPVEKKPQSMKDRLEKARNNSARASA